MSRIFNRLLGLLSIIALFIVTALGANLILPYFQEANILPVLTDQADQIETAPEEINETDNNQNPQKISRLNYDEHLQRGDMLAENNYFTLALKEYESAQNLNSAKPEAYIKAGQLQLKKQNFEEAEKNFQKALQKTNDKNPIFILLGQTLIGQKEFAQAKELFNGISQPDAQVHYYKGILAAFEGNTETAKTELNLALSGPAETKEKAQNYLDSFAEFEKFQAGSQNHLKTLLARSYNQTGEYVLAMETLYQVIRELPNYRDAWILLGYSFLKQENYLDAKNAFDKALAQDSEKAETHYFLGLAYFGLNELEKAILHLEIALENQFKPEIQVKQKLAEIYLLNENYAQAVEFYKQVLLNEQSKPEDYIRPVWIYIEHLKQPKEALTLSEQLLERYPDDAMSYNLLGWAALANNQLAQSRVNLEKALELNPNLDAAYLNIGMLYEKEQDFENAQINYKKAYKLGNGNSVGNLAATKYNSLLEQENKK